MRTVLRRLVVVASVFAFSVAAAALFHAQALAGPGEPSEREMHAAMQRAASQFDELGRELMTICDRPECVACRDEGCPITITEFEKVRCEAPSSGPGVECFYRQTITIGTSSKSFGVRSARLVRESGRWKVGPPQ